MRIFLSILLYVMFTTAAHAQIVAKNGYLIGNFLEIAVHGDGGHEGTADWPGNHARGGIEAVPFGFVANPMRDGWTVYDGDFFTAGTPENGFGLEINGVNYSNNAWNSIAGTYYLKEIPTAPGGTITHAIEEDCILVEWAGSVAGVRINVKYRLMKTELYYMTEVTLTNNTGKALNDVYYYRNVDPDNNEAIGGTFNTVNTIVSQPNPDCIKALVSAEQGFPWKSYVGMGALGDNFRVSHGGFSNRDGSNIWNAIGGLNGTMGAVVAGDKSISLAYKTDIAPGASVNFTYAIVLHELDLEKAFASLYHLNYKISDGDESYALSSCSSSGKETIGSCRGLDALLYIDGPALEDYNWVWMPDGVENDSIWVTPLTETIYTLVGTPISGCLKGVIEKEVMISFSGGPKINSIFPEPICGEYDLSTFNYWDTQDGENCRYVFLSEQPDSANQTEPAFKGPMMNAEDEVWLMVTDTTTGCYDVLNLKFNFIGANGAGKDFLDTICSSIGTTIDLFTLISDSADVFGRFEEIIFSGKLDEKTGKFFASGLDGTYVFMYILDDFEDCPGDTAYITLNFLKNPFADFEYNLFGKIIDDLPGACIPYELSFLDASVVADPDYIVSWEWDFDDGTVSGEENPFHAYYYPGEFDIRLKITTKNGCFGNASKRFTSYYNPDFSFVYSEPVCHGGNDGIIVVDVPKHINDYELTITNEAGDNLNEGLLFVDSLIAGVYTIYIEDAFGCSYFESVIINQPDPLEIYYRIQHPACAKDSGWVVVDSVKGENPNNPISYLWEPNPAGISGIGADSSYWMQAGDYALTATDTKGCFTKINFTLIDPPPFYFTEWGFDTAYCRMYNFQSGFGTVYAAAAGGVPNYVYEWTYLKNGATSSHTTWGGRSGGNHRIRVTDDAGCVLEKIIYVDSLNPKADFLISSLDLNAAMQGTAPVEVEFTNSSRYYSVPFDPAGDTLFKWDLDRTEVDDWMMTTDFFRKYDTIYGPRGASYDVEICLIAFNRNGCTDTACKEITIFEPPVLQAPNVFTPNGNHANDNFTFLHLQKGIKDFQCIILNRWGIQVGEIDGISDSWDGNDMSGQACADGVYFYSYTATGDNGKTFSGQGTVTILKSGRD